MESLALAVLWIFILTHLTGPIALVLAYYDFWLPGGLLGAMALVLGIRWYFGVYTWPRYLGLISAAMGAGALGIVLGRLVK